MACVADTEFCTMYSENPRQVSHRNASYLSIIEIVTLAVPAINNSNNNIIKHSTTVLYH